MDELRDRLRALPRSTIIDLASLIGVRSDPYKEFVKDMAPKLSVEFPGMSVSELCNRLRSIWREHENSDFLRYQNMQHESLITVVAIDLIMKGET